MLSHCLTHVANAREELGWAEKEAGTQLPAVNIALKELGANIREVIAVRTETLSYGRN